MKKDEQLQTEVADLYAHLEVLGGPLKSAVEQAARDMGYLIQNIPAIVYGMSIMQKRCNLNPDVITLVRSHFHSKYV